MYEIREGKRPKAINKPDDEIDRLSEFKKPSYSVKGAKSMQGKII